MKKSNLSNDLPLQENTKERCKGVEKYGKIYITFTDLYEMKQEGLERLLVEHGEVFILSKKIPPIKLTLAVLA